MLFSSRRHFLKTITAAAVASNSGISAFARSLASDGQSLLADFTPNRAPLAQNRFYLLPLTSIRPKGWLLLQLQIQACSLSGHLDEFWPDLGPQSGWLGGSGESWERGPYFLDGLVPLAHLLDDQTLLTKAAKWLDWTLSHPSPNGMIGPSNNHDWWPRMVMLKVLTQHYEATGDARVIPLMQRYFACQLRDLPARPLSDWGRFRWQDEVLSVFWLYNRTGNPALLRLAQLLHRQGFDWHNLYDHFPFRQKTSAKSLGMADNTPLPDLAMAAHGVNNAMGLKSYAVWSLFSQEASDRAGVARQLAVLDRYHGMPTGVFSADEHLAGRNPSQGVELCTVVENMFSLEQSLAILGDAALADRLERIAFNALPAAFTDDMWAHQYDQEPNQIECTLLQRPWSTNGPEANLFGLEPDTGCCTANMHQGWPKFAASLWMAAAQGGLAAVAYAPCELQTRIGGAPITITEETAYPFDGKITLTLQPSKPLRFPLFLRIPQWTRGALLKVNGDSAQSPQPGQFAVVAREWKPGDRVELIFPMKALASPWEKNSIVVQRGPLLFSLPIETEWRKLKTRGMTADWEARPKSPWNYALQVDSANSSLAQVARTAQPGQSIFSLAGAPLNLEVRGRKLPQWKEENGVAAELPPNPAPSAEPLEKLTLVPYAAAKLRITVFPSVAPLPNPSVGG